MSQISDLAADVYRSAAMMAFQSNSPAAFEGLRDPECGR